MLRRTVTTLRKPATVLVTIKNNVHFYRDDMGNIQYQCTNCHMTFFVNNNGKVVRIKLEDMETIMRRSG